VEKKRKKGRPYLGIIFKCCNVYSRIYLNKDKTAFVGRCPKCGRKAVIKVSKDGVSDRFFIAG